MSNAKLRGAIVGCCFFGQIQLEAWRRMEDVEIAAAADADLARAQAAAPRGYPDAQAMLAAETLDFLDIATRPDTHLPLLRLALSHGLPTIVQKPLAPTLREALDMQRLAQGHRVMAHENWRWQPWHREMKRRLAAGDIGSPLSYHLTMTSNDGFGENPYPNQPYFKHMPRLLMFESLIHPVDVARFYFGPILDIFAVTRRRNPAIAGEDRAVLTLVHKDLEGIVEGHRFLLPEPSGPAMGIASVEGEVGRLLALANGDILHNGKLVWQNQIHSGYKGDSVKATQEHFVHCLRTAQPFETNLDDYIASYAAVDAAYRSAQEGRKINLAEHLLTAAM